MSASNLSEYPNHLNPFKSRRNSISNSFRKVFRSFRGKDKEKPTKYTDAQPQRHTIQPSQSNHTGPVEFILPEVLPRSRFKERLEKTEVLKRESKDKQWYNDGVNPFEQEDKPNQIPPVPARKHRKRRKRTAPLPPGSVNGDGQYLDVPSRTGSKWSLTSTDTDFSSTCYSEAESDHPIEINEERSEEILQITREIAKFADDTNNNLTINHEISIKVEDVDHTDGTPNQIQPKNDAGDETINTNLPEKEDIPELIESVPQVLTEKEASNETETIEGKLEEKQESKDQDSKDQDNQEKTNKEIEVVAPSQEFGRIVTIKEEVTTKVPNGHVIEETKVISNGNATAIRTETKVTEEYKVSNGCVKNVDEKSSIVKTEDNGCESVNDPSRDLNQNRLRVKIIDNQEVVLRYPEPYDTDEDESRFSIQKKIQHFESFRDSSQVSKIRQTVLTKENLLGTD